MSKEQPPTPLIKCKYKKMVFEKPWGDELDSVFGEDNKPQWLEDCKKFDIHVSSERNCFYCEFGENGKMVRKILKRKNQ